MTKICDLSHKIPSFVRNNPAFMPPKRRRRMSRITPTPYAPFSWYRDSLLVILLILLTAHALHFVVWEKVSFFQEQQLAPPSSPPLPPNTELVFWSSFITMSTTGLGVLPFLFVKKELDPKWVAVANAIASGMMLSASIGLLEESLVDYTSFLRVALGLSLGMAFIIVSKLKLDEQPSFHFLDLNGMDAKKVALIMCVMTLHSLSEGIGIGVSYNSASLGSFISLTMAVHNVPEGVAIAIVLLPRGVTKMQTVLWCVLSSLPQPLMAVPAFLFVDAFKPLFAIGLGFAAGAMCYVAVFELLSDASEVLSSKRANRIAFVSAIMMAVVQVALRGDFAKYEQ